MKTRQEITENLKKITMLWHELSSQFHYNLMNLSLSDHWKGKYRKLTKNNQNNKITLNFAFYYNEIDIYIQYCTWEIQADSEYSTFPHLTSPLFPLLLILIGWFKKHPDLSVILLNKHASCSEMVALELTLMVRTDFIMAEGRSICLLLVLRL